MKNNKNIYCFFGVDGAGKTTTLLKVKKELERKGYPCKRFIMGRAGNHKLPFIRKFMEFKAKRMKIKRGISPKKHALLVDIYRKRGLAFMSIYFLDLWLRFFEIKKVAKKKIVMTDRFFYDGLALSKPRYVSFFRRLTPRVKSFFMHASPEVILKRKQEATAQNMVDYKRTVDKDLMNHFDIVPMDTSEPLKKVVAKIVKEIENDTTIKKRKVIEEFNKQKVNYAILRNYKDIENSKDIDILLDCKDGKKAKKILEEQGFIKPGKEWGLFKRCHKVFDIKTCIEYNAHFRIVEEFVSKKKKA